MTQTATIEAIETRLNGDAHRTEPAREPAASVPPMASVFLALPHYGSVLPETMQSVMRAMTGNGRIHLTSNCASLLAHNFNMLWCNALNDRESRRLTHFAMHHADIGTEEGWLDKLLAEMARVKADVLSVIIPIKDNRGLTSTGFQDPETSQIRRLTMTEVAKLPETFDASVYPQLGWVGEPWGNLGEPLGASTQDDGTVTHRYKPPSRPLMINTGLFLVDFARPWVEEVWFEIRDAIVRRIDGKFRANVLPEDWNFSGWCARKGLRVFATRAVKATHYGKAEFRNSDVWGEATDPGDRW